MYWQQAIQYAALSDVGFRRQNNQDSWVVKLSTDRETWSVRGHLFVVADGMGGHAVGELASKLAVDTVPHAFDKLRDLSAAAALKTAIEQANEVIHERGLQNREFLRMGTTCSTLLLGPNGAMIGHVGDSRVYRIRERRIDQLSCDHSLVWELIQQRKVHPRDADRLFPRNVITRSLGPEPRVQVDLEGPTPVLPGDVFVVCSDGLSTQLTDSEIGILAAELPAVEACRMMVHLANLRGGPDNITAIVVKVGPIPPGATLENSTESFPIPQTGGGWGLFFGYCLLAITFLAGLTAVTMTSRKLMGAVMMVLSFLIAFFIIYLTQRRYLFGPPQASSAVSYDPLATVIWRPYRTAPAKLHTKFLEDLSRLEAELQKAAREESWTVDWEKHDDNLRKAMSAAEKRKHTSALSEYAKCFDTLMTGLHEQRRRVQHEARWGKPGSPRPITGGEGNSGQ